AHDQTLAQSVSTKYLSRRPLRGRAHALRPAGHARAPRRGGWPRDREPPDERQAGQGRDDALTSRGGRGFRASAPHRYAARQRASQTHSSAAIVVHRREYWHLRDSFDGNLTATRLPAGALGCTP